MARVVLIEFTEDTFGEDGELKREKGTRLYVDPKSAHSFVDIKGVADRIENGEPVRKTRSRPKKVKEPEPEPESVEPDSEPAPEPEPVEVESG